MTKSDLVAKIAEHSGVAKVDVETHAAELRGDRAGSGVDRWRTR